MCCYVYFSSQYLSELLAEHQKLGPFMQVLPICSRLLNQGQVYMNFLISGSRFSGFFFFFFGFILFFHDPLVASLAWEMWSLVF